LSGAFLSIGQVGTFLPGMSNGRGFLAIAAVIFGAWRPVGILVASLIFGFGDALQLRLQGDPSVPWSVWLVLALIVGVGIAISLIYRYRSPSNGGLWTSRSIFAAGMFVLLLALAIYRPDITLSAQLWLALPYVFALVALAALRRRAAVPRYLTIPFVPGGSTT
jgi:simple sugar transport system permease protein